MYSTTIKTKVDTMFIDLRKKCAIIIAESSNSNEAFANVTKFVSSELSARSKFILSDMLFDLTDKQMETEFFSDISKQNKFYEINLYQEILNKYKFTVNMTVNYQEASREIQMLKVGGATLLAAGVIEVGVALTAGISLSRLVPGPISFLIVASIGAAIVDYFAIEPARNKKALASALDDYLVQAKKQFLGWFDEVEVFFNNRVEEIKQTV